MLDWNQLEEECLSCQKCALAQTRTNVVFGAGVRDAEVMFIGEGPQARTRIYRAKSLCWAGAASCWTTCWRSLT